MDRETIPTPREAYEQEEQKRNDLEGERNEIRDGIHQNQREIERAKILSKSQGEWTNLRAIETKAAETIIELAGKISYGIKSFQAGQSGKRLEGLRDEANEEALVEDKERELVKQQSRREIDEARESALALERRHEELQRQAVAALEALATFEQKQLGYKQMNTEQEVTEKPENKPNFE